VLRIVVLIAILAPILGLFCLYAVSGSVRLAPRVRPCTPWLWVVSIASLTLQLALYGLRSIPGTWDILGLPFWIAHFLFGLFMSFLLYLLIADGLWGLARRIFRLPSRWGEKVWATVAILSVASALVGLTQVLLPVPIERVEIPIRGLPSSLDGFRIVQLSDLHIGSPMRRRFVERIVSRANALSPDLFVITGDVVHAPPLVAVSDVEPLTSLQSKYGTLAITGNHDSRPWIPELARLGIRVLSNDHVVVNHNGTDLWLVGLPGLPHPLSPDDRPDIEKALQNVPANAIKVLLIHDPAESPGASRHGFQLQLSGHTHGGQFFPWSPVLLSLMPYSHGLHREGETWVYVSRGTGWWGPPNRFLVPPEMTVIALRAT